MFVVDAWGVVVNERYTGKERTPLLLLVEDVSVAAIGEVGCRCAKTKWERGFLHQGSSSHVVSSFLQ